MTTESIFPEKDLSLVAKERIRIGTVPDWVTPCKLDMGYLGQQKRPLTYLLISRQINAELNATFVHTAVRLETMEAVQHESQWRLPFEPSTQGLTLHWIRIRRGETVLDHTRPELFRLLQREEGLEKFVVDGWFTLLVLLEDVRPGDVLETCYTLTTKPRLLPEYCTGFFALPRGLAVGRYKFSVFFKSSRPLKWKSGSLLSQPSQSTEGDETIWDWSGENFTGPELEVNTPSWYLDPLWVQISDCPDWRTVARAVSNAWNRLDDDSHAAIHAIAAEIEAGGSDLMKRADKAIRLVQDNYRYLSVNLDLGGYVPTAPGIVIRRRFGDCKDLSLLLVQILQKIGSAARPVLVATGLRKVVAEMLPMTGLFDHVVVEIQLQGKTCWVDPTIKQQGGGAFRRAVSQFGFGLPVDPTSSDLAEQPRDGENTSVYELRDRILLSTSEASKLAIHVRATGSYADALRYRFSTVPVETIANERLQECARRFNQASRIGPLQHRDNRDTNEFLLVESFSIQGFLSPHEQPGWCKFLLPPSILFGALQLPDPRPRGAPFSIPFPCQIMHIVEVEAQNLQPMASPRFNSESKFLRFSRREKSLPRFWSMTLMLETLADAVPAADIADYRATLEAIWKKSGWGLVLPSGFSHPRGGSDFGELPPLPYQPLPSPPSGQKPAQADRSRVAAVAVNEARNTASTERPQSTGTSGQNRQRLRRSARGGGHSKSSFGGKDLLWLGAAIIIALGLSLVFYLLHAKHHK